MEEAVTALGDGKDGGEARPQFNTVKLLNVPREKLVDLTLEVTEGGLVVHGPIGYNVVVVLRADELDNTADEIAEVLQQ